MLKSTVVTAAMLFMGVTASYATTQQITGTYTLSYTPGTGVGSGGATGAPTFSSTPGDGAVATNLYNTNFGSVALSPTTVTVGFSQTLTVGASASTYNFFTVNPAGTCGTGCSTTTNPLTSTTNTTSGMITAAFTFTTPSGATGNATDTATYYADYNTNSANLGPNCPNGGSSTQTDCVFWSTANDPIVVSFSDGYTLKATLNNAIDWNITPTISLALYKTPVPEPASLAVLGSALAGLGLIRRRRNKA